MFLIKLITDRYGVGGITEEIIGYGENEASVRQYCVDGTKNLRYNMAQGVKYYTYDRIYNVCQRPTQTIEEE